MQQLLLSALFSILLIFATGQEVNGKECVANQKEPWSYSGENGPKNWGKVNSNCNGRRQSPIDIKTSNVVNNNSLTPFDFINYDKPITSAIIVNGNFTVKLTPKDGVTRSIRNGGLDDVYNLSEFHFHWGSRKTRGSDHTVNEKQYSMELHIVHTNSRNQYAVLGVFLEQTGRNNPALRPFVKTLEFVKYKGKQTTLQSPLDLSCMLPDNQKRYYQYSGSLTTPQCTESVTWTVFADVITVGKDQMKKFRDLYSTTEADKSDDCHLVDNFRPEQPLYWRIVTKPSKN